MLLSLFLLLLALSPSSQEICASPGALPAPTLYLNWTSARPGDSVQLQCSVNTQLLTTRIVFCQDGEEVSSQRGLLGKFTYDSHHVVSKGSSGNYSCGYEIRDSNNWVNKSQLSPAQHLSITDALPAPILYLNQTSARPGDSVRLQCSVVSWVRATRIIFYKDGEEVSSQMSLQQNLTYNYDHMVSGNSSGNYSCAYEIKDSDSQVIRSQFSLVQHLSVIGPDVKFLHLLLGVTVPVAVLVLAVALYLLGRKVVPRSLSGGSDPTALGAVRHLLGVLLSSPEAPVRNRTFPLCPVLCTAEIKRRVPAQSMVTVYNSSGACVQMEYEHAGD